LGFGEAGLSGCGPLVLWFIKVCWVKAGMAWYGGLGWGKARQGCGEFGVRIGRAGYGRRGLSRNVTLSLVESGSDELGFVSAGLLRLVRFLYEELWYGEVLNEKNYVSGMDLGTRRR